MSDVNPQALFERQIHGRRSLSGELRDVEVRISRFRTAVDFARAWVLDKPGRNAFYSLARCTFVRIDEEDPLDRLRLDNSTPTPTALVQLFEGTRVQTIFPTVTGLLPSSKRGVFAAPRLNGSVEVIAHSEEAYPNVFVWLEMPELLSLFVSLFV